MCDICVIEKLHHCTNSPWAAPTFVQPKKTEEVRVLIDLREVNKLIERKPFPLLHINDLIQKRGVTLCMLQISKSVTIGLPLRTLKIFLPRYGTVSVHVIESWRVKRADRSTG